MSKWYNVVLWLAVKSTVVWEQGQALRYTIYMMMCHLTRQIFLLAISPMKGLSSSAFQ